MELALQSANTARKTSPQVLPVLVLPTGDDNGYLAQKAYFSHAGLPTQVCTLRILEDDESLKWAIANLALQIFCKAGGKPWKVRPTAERSLIIGVSQSHKSRLVGAKVQIDKYFAFSVLTDSSGLFQQIQILSDSPDHSTYVTALRVNLKQILEDSAGTFNRVVIHTFLQAEAPGNRRHPENHPRGCPGCRSFEVQVLRHQGEPPEPVLWRQPFRQQPRSLRGDEDSPRPLRVPGVV